jgi:hypothetical protein
VKDIVSILKRINYKYLLDASFLAIVWGNFYGIVLYIIFIFLYLFGILKLEKSMAIYYSICILGITLYCLKFPPDFIGKVISTIIFLTLGYKKMRI